IKKYMDLHSENANKDNFSKFCEVFLKNLNAPISPRFSTKSTEEQISLKRVLEIHPPPAGESLTSVHGSPFLEVLKKKGFEVLLLVDSIT
ncbi:hypothetical protein B0H19DRAFT_955832, partial [Mycena capillaripes]